MKPVRLIYRLNEDLLADHLLDIHARVAHIDVFDVIRIVRIIGRFEFPFDIFKMNLLVFSFVMHRRRHTDEDDTHSIVEPDDLQAQLKWFLEFELVERPARDVAFEFQFLGISAIACKQVSYGDFKHMPKIYR